MNTVLVFVETREGRVTPQARDLLASGAQVAQAAGAELEALVIGPLESGELAHLKPAHRTIHAGDARAHDYIPPVYGRIAAQVVRERSPLAVIFPYSTIGMDLAPFVAESTGRPVVSFCASVTPSGDGFEATARPHGGKLTATVAAPLGTIFAMVPETTPSIDREAASMPELVAFDSAQLTLPDAVKFVAKHAPDPNALDLTAVERIVCVGRGIGKEANIQGAAIVAQFIGAEIAGSRPVIDSGWLPKPRQVGKSGSRVSPKIYIALCVSGAPEHLEGMSRSELIIAVNKDPDAPIFEVAHYGAVVDVMEFLEEFSRLMGAEAA